jgi:predicted nuclease with TOPRIM domain
MGLFSKNRKTDEEFKQIFEEGNYEDLSKSELVKLTGMYVDAKMSLESKIIDLKTSSRNSASSFQKEINGLQEQLSKLNQNYYELNQKYNSSTSKNKKLTDSLEIVKKQLSEQEEKYQTLDDKFNNLSIENTGLQSEVAKLKEPFKFEDLQALIGEHKNKEYQKIKESLVKSFLELGVDSLYSGKNKDSGIIGETIELLASNGVQRYYNDGTVDKVSLSFEMGSNNYLLSKERINSMKVHFEDSINYENELRHGYSAMKFKVSTDIDDQDRFAVNFSLNCPEKNMFREMIMQDSALFIKAALMGEAKKLIKNQNYSTAMNLIKNNGLEEFALPYIQNNMDNKEMVSYFASLVQDK